MNSAIAVGVFDGVHLGHREILSRALARARARGGRCVVVSFDPHPDVVLARSFQPSPPIAASSARRSACGVRGGEG